MPTEQDLKEIVKQKYGEIALQDKATNQSSCCGSGECSTEVYNIMTDDYTNVQGYNPDADLGLGCGLPTEFANIEKGDTVVDLGSGAGNDCFIARDAVGERGKVIGIDFTPAMIERARLNAEIRGFNNVEFRQGETLAPAPNSAGFLMRHIAEVELLFAKNIFTAESVQVHAKSIIAQKDTGDWTNLGELLSYQEKAHDTLKEAILSQEENLWQEPVTTNEFGTKTKAAALGRVVTRTAYHAGQLAIILKYGK